MHKIRPSSVFRPSKWRQLFAERGHSRTPQTFSGAYEDLLVSRVFDEFGIAQPSYFDIGAYAPIEASNTYLFYKRGASGVLIEPNPLQLPALRALRRRDLCLNAGVAAGDMTLMDFFVMSDRQLSTFRQADAEQLQAAGGRTIVQVAPVPVVSINALMEQHGCPDYVSLDTEGNDLAILANLDFGRFRPRVFCVETITFSDDRAQKCKNIEIGSLMSRRGYFAYADTFSNTIFVDRAWWGSHSSEEVVSAWQ